MRFSYFILGICFVLCSYKGNSQNLESYHGKNNIILLKDSSTNSDWLQGQLKRLKANDSALEDRHLLILLVTDSLVHDEIATFAPFKSQEIVNTYGIENFEGLILIDKDGVIKLKEEFIVSPQKIFDIIDALPFRQSEYTDVKKID